ncbi:uncharacterized protein LOC142353652 isoform X2 [Convolutriloba macropyga]|uniref:uncharacterized protein LOC142353652 isoform X2 n=1 Tax=Convolutriloba macropyga TaxID=536237 RepID=UPI003F52574E
MGRGIQQKSLKRTKRERVKNRLAKLEAVQKAKDDGTYIPKPWENRPLIQELYSFAIKSHKTQKAADAEHQNGDGQSTAGSDGDSIMDLDLRSPGTPRSVNEEETGSVHSKDDNSSLTSHSSKYSLRNIEKQLLSKLQSASSMPDWLSRKDKRKVYRNMRKMKKKKTPRFQRIKRRLQARENSKMDQQTTSDQSVENKSGTEDAASNSVS